MCIYTCIALLFKIRVQLTQWLKEIIVNIFQFYDVTFKIGKKKDIQRRAREMEKKKRWESEKNEVKGILRRNLGKKIRKMRERER